MNILSICGLTKRYPKFTLNNINFTLECGRIMGLIGKNGAGKTTILKSILNLIHYDEGDIKINCDTGVVLGEINFYTHKKLKDITDVTKRFYINWDNYAYEKYLGMFEIDPQKRVKELSAGMRVKYMIALALSHNAGLLIMDEPTSGLDPVARDDLLQLFRGIVKNGDKSILYSTHITSDLEKCADDITYIKNGGLLYSGAKSDFIKYFQDSDTELSIEEIMIRSERNNYDF